MSAIPEVSAENAADTKNPPQARSIESHFDELLAQIMSKSEDGVDSLALLPLLHERLISVCQRNEGREYDVFSSLVFLAGEKGAEVSLNYGNLRSILTSFRALTPISNSSFSNDDVDDFL